MALPGQGVLAEPLDEQFVQATVFLHRGDCRVEDRDQLIAFAQAHADAAAECDRLENDHQVAVFIRNLGEEIVVGEDRVSLSIAHGSHGFVGRSEFQKGHTFEFGQVSRLDGVGLCRDHRAVEFQILVHTHVEGWRIGDICLGEVDHFVALVGDRHAGDDGVVVARGQIRDDAVPLVGDPFAGQLGAGAEFIAKGALEAVDLAVIVDEVVGGVGTFGAHAHDGVAVSHGHACRQRQRRCDKNQFLHYWDTPCWLANW
mmetsp:Transcript_1972/g.3641  ORF Transcript_1972/g.3641 Transcript_1972/m.3641 type:complete len:257 (-) Transcript_1972:200-970(-)